jgi:hypothetical protein
MMKDSSPSQVPRVPPTVMHLRYACRATWEVSILRAGEKRRPFDPCQSQLVIHLQRLKATTADIQMGIYHAHTRHRHYPWDWLVAWGRLRGVPVRGERIVL